MNHIDNRIIKDSLDTIISYQKSVFQEKISDLTIQELFFTFLALQQTLPSWEYKHKIDKIMNSSSKELLVLIKNTDFKRRKWSFSHTR
jgi:hypothetical protein